MFGSIKKFFDNKRVTPLLYIDIHSHLIPNIDDGVKSFDESIKILKTLESIGYKKVITTPHVIGDCYNNSTKKLLDMLYLLRQKAKENGIDIELDISAEYYCDEEFVDRLKSNDLLPILGRYILFETSYVSLTPYLLDIVYQIKLNGYIPLLAHPERYNYISNFAIYSKWREVGIKFQINILSFDGYYGIYSKKRVEFLAKSGFIDVIGSDIHSYNDVLKIQKLFKKGLYEYIFKDNTIINSSN